MLSPYAQVPLGLALYTPHACHHVHPCQFRLRRTSPPALVIAHVQARPLSADTPVGTDGRQAGGEPEFVRPERRKRAKRGGLKHPQIVNWLVPTHTWPPLAGLRIVRHPVRGSSMHARRLRPVNVRSSSSLRSHHMQCCALYSHLDILTAALSRTSCDALRLAGWHTL